MKTLRCVVLGWLILVSLVERAQASAAISSDTSYAVVERGAHHRVWQRVAWATNRLGQAVARTNAYTELATGIHKFQSGSWQEASAVIESFPEGAIARQGQYQVVFASDAATVGAIDLQTPDGKRLRSHLLGLGYYDEASGKSVLIAEVTNCLGVVVSPNQVLYENVFTGLKASIRYTCTLAGFEQDVLILEQPPAPEEFGLDAKTTRLQVLTEFLSPPAPVITEDARAGGSPDQSALPDPVLDFGVMQMGRGLAFPASSGEDPTADAVPVGKRWQQWQGRQFLIEEVKLPTVRKQLEALPVRQASAAGTIRQAAHELQWPERLLARTEPRQPMQLARLDSPPRGFVLDYTLMTSDTNFTFQSGNTYYVSGTVNLNGTTTIENDVVVKFTNTVSAKLNLTGPVVCETDSYQPAVFTAKDDYSVGSIITGSTGTPSGYYGYMVTGPSAAMAFHDCRFAYANRAITHSGDLYLTNVQFVACSRPIYGQGSDHTITVDNALFYTNGMIFDHGIGTIFCGQHLTVQQAGSIAATSGSVDCSIYLTNCLIAGLTSWGKNVEDSYTNQVAWLSSGTGLFQSVGAGTHYLAESSPYRDVGTTNLGSYLLAAIQEMTTYPPPTSTVDTNTPDLGYHYPVLTDFDLDGMEDGWEWKHFGTITNNGSGDYDSDSTSDLDECVSGSDPNDIVFDVQFENLRVRTNTAAGSFVVLKGQPAQVAVLVDNTNFAAAVWSNYTATVSATLGTTDGTYHVWIGLKGRASDSTASWGDWPITRDTVAPSITITNPTALTLSQPILQLQGYGIEPLSSVRYDLTNAAGTVTNAEGYVTKQWFDTNLFEFTTNWFECVDIGLTNGTNLITLRATDLAGNVTTNINAYVLDYSGDSTAPALTVYWPQNGTKVSGTNFALRGWLDDPTATVVAEMVDANGVTNAGNVEIERDGLLWVEDLPFGAGTNTLTLTLTDAASNVSVTNLQVIQSAVTLAIDDLASVNVNQRRVSITGTINVTNHTVWVNGAQASFTGQNGQGLYTWSAADVPVNTDGTALFQAVAIPNTDNGGNGTGGSGGSAATLQNPGNPTSATATPVEAEKAKEPEIVTVHYHKKWVYVRSGPDTFSDSRTIDIKWNLNRPGYWKNDQCYGNSYSDNYYYGWNQRLWDEFDIGIIQGELDAGHKAEVCGVRDLHVDDSPFTPPPWAGEVSKGGEFRSHTEYYETVERDARTIYELHTGGKKKLGGLKNLFVLTASAEGHANFFYPEIDEFSPVTYPISKAKIELGDLGKLGDDGRLYVLLGDNETHNVTPTVPGSRYYRFDQPGRSKHYLRIQANDNILEESEFAPEVNFCVGQKIDFSPVWLTDPPENLTATTFKWEFDGNFVNYAEQPCSTCSVNWSQSPELLTEQSTCGWWTSGGFPFPGLCYCARLEVKLTFANGQKLTMHSEGCYHMFRPRIENYQIDEALGSQIWHGANPGTGSLETYAAASFSATIYSSFDGRVGVTQVINGYATNSALAADTEGCDWLDNHEFNLNRTFPVHADVFFGDTFWFGDGPRISLGGDRTVMHWDFEAYARFKPDGIESIYVTLGTVNWHDYAESHLVPVPNTSYSDYFPLPPPFHGPADPGEAEFDTGLVPSEAFPYWDGLLLNQE